MHRAVPSLPRILSIAALAAASAGAGTARAAERERPAPHVADSPDTVVDLGPNRLLLTTGAATFAFAYGAALWVGATSGRDSDRPMVVPFAGPWLALGTRGACGTDVGRPCGLETTYAALMIADGLAQAAGAVQIALAFAHRDVRSAKAPVVNTTRVRFTPTRSAGGGLGLAALGEF